MGSWVLFFFPLSFFWCSFSVFSSFFSLVLGKGVEVCWVSMKQYHIREKNVFVFFLKNRGFFFYLCVFFWVLSCRCAFRSFFVWFLFLDLFIQRFPSFSSSFLCVRIDSSRGGFRSGGVCWVVKESNPTMPILSLPPPSPPMCVSPCSWPSPYVCLGVVLLKCYVLGGYGYVCGGVGGKERQVLLFLLFFCLRCVRS